MSRFNRFNSIDLIRQGRSGIATIAGRPDSSRKRQPESANCSPTAIYGGLQNRMSSSVQYSALTRLLTHNTRVHDMEEMLKRMWVPAGWTASGEDIGDAWIPNPFAELQDDLDRESRACLVSCWAALPAAREDDDLFCA